MLHFASHFTIVGTPGGGSGAGQRATMSVLHRAKVRAAARCSLCCAPRANSCVTAAGCVCSAACRRAQLLAPSQRAGIDPGCVFGLPVTLGVSSADSGRMKTAVDGAVHDIHSGQLVELLATQLRRALPWRSADLP